MISRQRILACAFLFVAPAAQAQQSLPTGFVYLRDVDPSIAQDIRYAGADNFVGRALPGYDAAECVMRRDAALALRQVQADLAPSGFALKVYDCYRPARASRAMLAWANDGKPGDKRYYPKLEKQALFRLGYIASSSAHSAGATVDLTLIEKGAAASQSYGRLGSCTAPANERAPDNSLDMGTTFDCFDSASHTKSGAITPEQRQRRAMLVAAMSKHGFRNYFREWWHFSYAPAGRGAHHDFPIRPR